MLSVGEALATWQLSADPRAMRPGGQLPARRLADHRAAYLTCEGPVSGGRGEVRRVDGGLYGIIRQDETCWEFSLAGQAVSGRFELRRVAGDDAAAWAFRRLAEP